MLRDDTWIRYRDSGMILWAEEANNPTVCFFPNLFALECVTRIVVTRTCEIGKEVKLLYIKKKSLCRKELKNDTKRLLLVSLSLP